MAQLAIINDQDVEVAVLVDTETYTALPIVAVGAGRVELLQAFVDMPFDLSWFTDEGLREAWGAFLRSRGILTDAVEADTSTQDQVGVLASDNGDGGAPQAEAEAHAATDVPPPQPADTDETASAPAETVTTVCWNCEGAGHVSITEGEVARECGVCHGTGKVEQVVA